MNRTIKTQEIAYAKNEVLKAGKTYTGSNGSKVILNSFYEDYDGGLMISYSAHNPDLHQGWAAGDTSPNTFYHWIFPDGKYA